MLKILILTRELESDSYIAEGLLELVTRKMQDVITVKEMEKDSLFW
jgi:hypothetical protein